MAVIAPTSAASAADGPDRTTAGSVEVIVQQLPGAGDAPERRVRLAGGVVHRQLPVIDGFAAQLPAVALAALRAAPGVRAVTANAPVRLSGGFDGFAPKQDPGSMYWVGQEVTGAGEFWDSGARARAWTWR